MLKFKVVGQLLIFQDATTIVSDSVEYLEAQFTFSADWAGTTKIAHFKKDDTVFDMGLNSDNQIVCTDHLDLSAGEWEVYVHGITGTERITSSSVFITVEQSGILNGEPLPEVPLTMAEQILNTAQSVRTDADNGVFDGAVFTPHIEAGTNSFTISWTNNKGLQNPEPVTINITV